MDVCPSCFSALQSLVLKFGEPEFLSTEFENTAPLTVELTWDQPMDTTVLPPFAVFEGVLDGIPTTPIDLAWASSTVLEVDFPGGALSTSGVLNLLTENANLRAATLDTAKPPQTIDFFP